MVSARLGRAPVRRSRLTTATVQAGCAGCSAKVAMPQSGFSRPLAGLRMREAILQVSRSHQAIQLSLFDVVNPTPCPACRKVNFSSTGRCRTCSSRASAARYAQAKRPPKTLKRCDQCWGPLRATQSRHRICEDCAPSLKYRGLVYRLGIDRHMLDAMYFDQDGKCAIPTCLREAVCVDHCHATGRVRGLLCARCNCAIGFVENELWLGAALAFLS